MEEYKTRFIDFLLSTGALRVGGDYSLKSKRSSPWFVNVGDFNGGQSSRALGEFYADSLLHSNTEFDLVYGIPEKGNALAVSTAIGLYGKGKDVPWFFTRKSPKNYGEATNQSADDRIKALVVGRAPKNGQSIAQLDDVFTAGDAKYEARAVLQSLGNFNLSVLAIAVDRQEVGIDGKSAISEYERTTGTKVVSIVSAEDVYSYLREKVPLQTSGDPITTAGLERMATYLRVYGTEAARTTFGKKEKPAVEREKSIIPACDVDLDRFEELVKQTADVEGIGGYKIPARSGRKGWERWVETARKYTKKPLIYDHQKAGTDIPDTGQDFMKDLKGAGIDTVILFPQAGPETERAWIYHALDNGLGVIVGGRMTHPGYAQSEGGFISDEGALEMYRIAARSGVTNFVVPGNKPDIITTIRGAIEAEGIDPVFYAPGFVAQGGKIEDTTKIAGDRWHAIVGRGIFQANDMKKAALEHTSQL